MNDAFPILNTIFLISAGFSLGCRTWLYYNFLRANENKKAVSIIEYINADKNLVINFWKVIPAFEVPLNRSAKNYKSFVNALTILFYLFAFLFILTFDW